MCSKFATVPEVSRRKFVTQEIGRSNQACAFNRAMVTQLLLQSEGGFLASCPTSHMSTYIVCGGDSGVMTCMKC